MLLQNGSERLIALAPPWVCLHGGFYADGVSRAYYAILHAAKAALQLRDVTAESHAAVKRLTWPAPGAAWARRSGMGRHVRAKL